MALMIASRSRGGANRTGRWPIGKSVDVHAFTLRESPGPPYRLQSTRHLAAARAAVRRILVIAIRPAAKCAGTAPNIGSRSGGPMQRGHRYGPHSLSADRAPGCE